MEQRYFIVYKPYRMVSQFVSPYDQTLLGKLDFDFPTGTHAVGRLDEDSEGLLILTTDKSLTKRLLHPDRKHSRHYIVQVKKKIEADAVMAMSGGLDIVLKKRGLYRTQPCLVRIIDAPVNLPDRENSVPDFVSHSWLEVVLTEGKNRQIRKMCSAVNHRCKRLIRTRIEGLELGSMRPGEVKEMDKETLFNLLQLKE